MIDLPVFRDVPLDRTTVRSLLLRNGPTLGLKPPSFVPLPGVDQQPGIHRGLLDLCPQMAFRCKRRLGIVLLDEFDRLNKAHAHDIS